MSNIIALILATVVLILIPGPNVALIVANSLRHGLKFGLITTLGTTAGIAIQLFLVIAGMAALIELAASALIWIKWLGVAYFVYLGLRTWNEPAHDLAQIYAQSESGTFWRGFGLAVINPKTLSVQRCISAAVCRRGERSYRGAVGAGHDLSHGHRHRRCAVGGFRGVCT